MFCGVTAYNSLMNHRKKWVRIGYFNYNLTAAVVETSPVEDVADTMADDSCFMAPIVFGMATAIASIILSRIYDNERKVLP